MPRFSQHFSLGASQHELDFVDVSNTFDTPVYVDPYAIEIQDDDWAARASEHIRVFFKELLDKIKQKDILGATNLMSHLSEPKETFLGVSKGDPNGRGVGAGQARQLILAIRSSKAYKSGLLSDLSEMALYVEGIDRDKISDLTTNIIRGLLVEYTQQQCELHEIETRPYSGPPLWDPVNKDWRSQYVQLPYIENSPVLLVPKYIVRRRLSLDSQEFYNKQITDFLVSEHERANSSLVKMIKGQPKVYKGAVREAHPKSKTLLADTVKAHPEILNMYKEIARNQRTLESFDDHDDTPNLVTICLSLSKAFEKIPSGASHATEYQKLVKGALTALFYPDLILPRIEWDIHGGRKRIDIVFTNAANIGFFAHRRDDATTEAKMVIVECKNYSTDIANPEFDQLLGRFDKNRGKFGIIACRQVKDAVRLKARCLDASSRSQGYIIVLTDADIVEMLIAKSKFNEDRITNILHEKFNELLA